MESSMQISSFNGLPIYPENSNYVRNQWASIFSHQLEIFPFPILNYAFYGTGFSNEEKMIVVDDSSSVIFTTKMIKLTDGQLRSSCYAIVKSKVYVVEILTGRFITSLKELPEKINNDIGSFYQSSLVKYPNVNPYDRLCYYIPKESGTSFHAVYTENGTDYSKDFNTKIQDIHSNSLIQKKRFFFGMLQIDKNFNNIFNLSM